MARRIYKYQLGTVDRQIVKMPDQARVLCAMNQGGLVTLWAEVWPDAPKVDRVFWIIGTGNPMPDMGVAELTYIGSVLQPPFVWHVYEEVKA